jgi:hypothetical protein
MERDEPVRQILAMWHRHTSVLLDTVPTEGLGAVPAPRP